MSASSTPFSTGAGRSDQVQLLHAVLLPGADEVHNLLLRYLRLADVLNLEEAVRPNRCLRNMLRDMSDTIWFSGWFSSSLLLHEVWQEGHPFGSEQNWETEEAYASLWSKMWEGCRRRLPVNDRKLLVSDHSDRPPSRSVEETFWKQRPKEAKVQADFEQWWHSIPGLRPQQQPQQQPWWQSDPSTRPSLIVFDTQYVIEGHRD